jgi:hypothetical protein
LTSGHWNGKKNFSPEIIEYGSEVIICIDVNFFLPKIYLDVWVLKVQCGRNNITKISDQVKLVRIYFNFWFYLFDVLTLANN